MYCACLSIPTHTLLRRILYRPTYSHCCFHNGLTHILVFRDNQEKLNHKAIRQDIFIIIVLLTCIGIKNKNCTEIKGQGHSQ